MNNEKETFESKMNRLEEILDKVETETLSLEESLKLFEEGNKLKNELLKELKEAEEKLEKLTK